MRAVLEPHDAREGHHVAEGVGLGVLSAEGRQLLPGLALVFAHDPRHVALEATWQRAGVLPVEQRAGREDPEPFLPLAVGEAVDARAVLEVGVVGRQRRVHARPGQSAVIAPGHRAGMAAVADVPDAEDRAAVGEHRRGRVRVVGVRSRRALRDHHLTLHVIRQVDGAQRVALGGPGGLLLGRGVLPGTGRALDRVADLRVGLGLRRLARQDPEKALDLLDLYARQMAFSSDEKVAIAREIGLTLARRFDARALKVMAQYDPELRDNTVTEWRTRLLLRLGRWDEAYQLTRQLPEDLAKTTRWRYWQARSLQLAQPQSQQPLLGYQPLARERDYYGFLAADRIQAPYSLNHKPLPLDPRLLQKVRNTAGIRRAMEFHNRGLIADGRREWYHVSRLFSRDEMVAQAKLAYDMQWYFPAIRTISQAQYWDDLDIRFPMAYRDNMVREARLRGLHSSWVFAITRQESAFMNDARSGVGAMGLMQLMPATAKETAKRYGIPLANPQLAYQPDINIQLGAAYLNQVLGQFNGNRVLASAAYNAGPGRVRQWLKDAKHLSFDVWVETIPFDETRQYVQNVLSYAVIYGKKLNAPQPLVDWHERFFDAQ